MNWIKKLFGKKQNVESVKPDELVNVNADEDVQEDPEMKRMMERGFESREFVLASLGEVDSDVMSPLMNPAFMGGPAWPSFRQSWRTVRRENSIMVASDGLSDPFEDEKIPLGFKVEAYAETEDKIENVHASWLLSLVYQVSQIIAHYGNVHEMLEKYNTLSTVAFIEGLPDEWVNSEGNAGIILGTFSESVPDKISLDEGDISFLSVKLLHPKELEFLESDAVSEEKRNELVKLFKGDHLSSLNRESVV